MDFDVLEKTDDVLEIRIDASGFRWLFFVMAVFVSGFATWVITAQATRTTTLECRRSGDGGGQCTRRSRSWVSESTTEVPLSRIHRVQVTEGDDGATLHLAQRRESTTFPLPEDAADREQFAARVRAIAVDGQPGSVRRRHDPPFDQLHSAVVFGMMALGFLLFPMLARMETVVRFSRADGTFELRRRHFWSRETVERPLDRVADVVVEKRGDDRTGGGGMSARGFGRSLAGMVDVYRLVAVTEYGERIPLSRTWDRPRERLDARRDEIFKFLADR